LLEVLEFLRERLIAARQAGVTDIIVDPGFGFGKKVEHNLDLLRHLETFSVLRVPVMVGLSRKSMLKFLIKTSADEALNGTTVLHTIALRNGADILRVHDVKEAKQAINIVKSVYN
jgi:dihydropteroate synthase